MRRKCLSFVLRSIAVPRAIYSRLLRMELEFKIAHVGRRFIYDPPSSVFVTPESISIGNYVFLNKGAYLSGDITFRKNIMCGPFLTVLAGSHIYGVRGKSTRFIRRSAENPEVLRPVVVEDEVWIGANVMLVGPLTVGVGAVIGAGSVVVKDVPPLTVAVGNPCRAVRRVFDDPGAVEHLVALGYSLQAANDIVARRAQMLADLELPVFDVTQTCCPFLYNPDGSA